MKRVNNALRKQNTDRNNNLTKVIAIFSRIGNQKEDLSFYLHIHFAKSKIDKWKHYRKKVGPLIFWKKRESQYRMLWLRLELKVIQN